jgi:hypothetical protein
MPPHGSAVPGEVTNAVLGAKGGELPHCLPVGAAGVGIADVQAQEVAHRDASYPNACGEASKMSRALLWFSAVLRARGSCGVPV